MTQTTTASTGVWTISAASALPQITKTITIDATTQSGYNGSPLIAIDGGSAGSGASGIVLAAGSDGSTVKGLDIEGFSGDGIDVASANNTILGDYIGVDASGTDAFGNGGDGISITSNDNVVGGATPDDRNIISSDFNGIAIAGNGNQIEGNYIGSEVTGTASLANAREGIEIVSGAGNIIGGAVAGAGNVIIGQRPVWRLDLWRRRYHRQ